MKTIEQLKEEHAKQLEAAIKYEEAKGKIFEALSLPEDTKIHPHCCYSDYVLCLNVETLQEALELAENMNPVNIFYCKDSCASFIPEGHAKIEKFNNPIAVGPWTYRVDKMREYTQNQHLEFYIDSAGYRLRVDIDVKTDPLTRIDAHFEAIRGGYRRTSCRVINESGHFTKQVKWYAGDDCPNSFTLY